MVAARVDERVSGWHVGFSGVTDINIGIGVMVGRRSSDELQCFVLL